MMAENRTKKAAQKLAEANRWRGVPDRYATRDADRLEADADELLTPELPAKISAGEAVPAIEGTDHRQRSKRIDIRDTLRNPDQVARDASAERTELLLQDRVDVTAMAIDAAESIAAGNSLEKMLAHQLSLSHKMSFELADKGMRLTDYVHSHRDPKHLQIYNTEAVRLINASARLMRSYQDGLTTLQKLRTGGSQTMTVQHVHVSDGGQAVIGQVDGRGHKQDKKEK